MITTNGSAKRPLVWLTFDDGPHPDFTPLVLDALLSHGVRATFFVIGEQAEQYPELVRRMVREGHAIGHHTYFHRGFDATTNRQLLEGVRRTSDVLFDLVGRRPTFFRPPHGRMRISAMCRLWAAGQVIVLWNSDPKDYSLASPEELVQWFRKHPLQGGDIALLHDNRPCAAAALPEIIEDVRQRRLEFATIDDPALFG
jgi:peptidoglycan/xylan/chitin deacetylase (PgdA/CDA1 family)